MRAKSNSENVGLNFTTALMLSASLVACSTPNEKREASVPTTAPAQTDPDPIDQLVAWLSLSRGLWVNGLSPTLNLPASASTAQIISAVFQKISFNKGQVTKHSIIESRDVNIPGGATENYRAVLVETDLGNKIVLLKYEQPNTGWWSRVYETGEKQPSP